MPLEEKWWDYKSHDPDTRGLQIPENLGVENLGAEDFLSKKMPMREVFHFQRIMPIGC